MKEFKTSLTEPQLEAMRLLYVTNEKLLPAWTAPKELEELTELGLAGRHESVEQGVSYGRTELGIGYIKSLGWSWDFWKDPHLPSPGTGGVD